MRGVVILGILSLVLPIFAYDSSEEIEAEFVVPFFGPEEYVREVLVPYKEVYPETIIKEESRVKEPTTKNVGAGSRGEKVSVTVKEVDPGGFGRYKPSVLQQGSVDSHVNRDEQVSVSVKEAGSGRFGQYNPSVIRPVLVGSHGSRGEQVPVNVKEVGFGGFGNYNPSIINQGGLVDSDGRRREQVSIAVKEVGPSGFGNYNPNVIHHGSVGSHGKYPIGGNYPIGGRPGHHDHYPGKYPISGQHGHYPGKYPISGQHGHHPGKYPISGQHGHYPSGIVFPDQYPGGIHGGHHGIGPVIVTPIGGHGHGHGSGQGVLVKPVGGHGAVIVKPISQGIYPGSVYPTGHYPHGGHRGSAIGSLVGGIIGTAISGGGTRKDFIYPLSHGNRPIDYDDEDDRRRSHDQLILYN